MHPAEQIRSALARVTELRDVAAGQPALQKALGGIRQFQAQRFASTYADLVEHQIFSS